MVGIDETKIRHIQIYESPMRRLIIIINKHHLDIKDKFVEYEIDMSNPNPFEVRKAALH